MDQTTIDLVEAGDMCQGCGLWLPEGETEEGHGLGSPVFCQECTDLGTGIRPIVDRTPD